MNAKTQVKNLVRRLKARSQSPVRKVPIRCINGPLSGHTLYLSYGHYTLPFTLHGHSGRYVRGKWEPSQ